MPRKRDEGIIDRVWKSWVHARYGTHMRHHANVRKHNPPRSLKHWPTPLALACSSVRFIYFFVCYQQRFSYLGITLDANQTVLWKANFLTKLKSTNNWFIWFKTFNWKVNNIVHHAAVMHRLMPRRCILQLVCDSWILWLKKYKTIKTTMLGLWK